MAYHLLIDAGNTCIKLAAAEHGKLFAVDSMPTSSGAVHGSLEPALRQFLASFKLSPGEMESCLCASVVPWLEPSLAEVVRELFGKPALFVPRDVPVPLNNLYPADQLGADRLVGVYGARRMFPKAPDLLCVDFGTAITFDLVSGDSYLGGLICPGVQSAADGLAANAARLPRLILDDTVDPTRVLGTSTRECMQFGLLQGFAALTDGVIERIVQYRSREVGLTPLVVATGGMAAVLAPASKSLENIVENLVLQGLCFLLREV